MPRPHEVSIGSRAVVNLRMLSLASAFVFAAGCASSAPETAPASPAPSSPSPSQSAATLRVAKSPLHCYARVSNKRPRDHASVSIQVHTKGPARVAATDALSVLHGQSKSGRASAGGELTLRFSVSDATPGSLVVVDVRVSLHGRKGNCWGSFRPRSSPAATRSPTPSPSPPPPTPTSCYPLSNEGTCYEPGEFCRNSDHGASGLAGDGERIICEDNDGWRWEPA